MVTQARESSDSKTQTQFKSTLRASQEHLSNQFTSRDPENIFPVHSPDLQVNQVMTPVVVTSPKKGRKRRKSRKVLSGDESLSPTDIAIKKSKTVRKKSRMRNKHDENFPSARLDFSSTIQLPKIKEAIQEQPKAVKDGGADIFVSPYLQTSKMAR